MAAPTNASARARKATPPARRPAAAARKRGAAVPKSAPPAPPTLAGRASDPSVRRLPVTVGVRELRQNLSVYLAQVKQGVAMQVTEHGRVVAVLTPVPASASRYDILLAQGLITPATRSIRDLPPPKRLPPGSPSISDILVEMRNEERY